MMVTRDELQSYRGAAWLSYGFRPFFIGGALWSAVAMLLWILTLSSYVNLPSAFTPPDWHTHELIYGYVPAVMAGFLLTAIPNWTGRPPIAGATLLGLLLVWVAGRLAVLGSLWIGPETAAVIDLLFLASLGTVVAREIFIARNTRNLIILIVVLMLLGGNATFHLETLYGTGTGIGTRIGISATILLIIIIGGRIIPNFTRNWLVKREVGRLPAPFDRYDAGTIALSTIALASWTIIPEHIATALLLLAAGMLNLFRLSRWTGDRTAAEWLLLILHLAYLFIPAGFLLLALSLLLPERVGSTVALHCWTVGAIGLMTLAVMTRASLGHTGQPLIATRPIQIIYAAAIIAACARVAAGLGVMAEPMLLVSAAAWILAFCGFLVAFAPLLLGRGQ